MCATVKRLQAVNIFCSNFIICLLVFFPLMRSTEIKITTKILILEIIETRLSQLQ